MKCKGTVSRVFLTRGFGFLVGDEDGEDYFMHIDDFDESIKWESVRKGDRVTFEAVKGRGGNKRQAINIERDRV